MDTDMSIRIIESKNEGEIINAISISLNQGRCCFTYKDNDKYGAIISFNDKKTINFPKYERPSRPGKMSKDEVNWDNVPQWTKVQVRDNKEEEWKNAYFLSFDKKASDFQFEITFNDEFISEDVLISRVYNQCRLYKED